MKKRYTNPGDKRPTVFTERTAIRSSRLICLVGETFDENEPLLLFDPVATWKKTLLAPGTYTMRELPVQVFKDGKCVYHSPKVMDIQKYCKESLTPYG